MRRCADGWPGKRTTKRQWSFLCENIDAVSDDFIEDASIVHGAFDNVADCGYVVPSHWDIGKVYKRLIKMVAAYEKIGKVVTAKLFGIKSAGEFVRKYDTINW